MYIMYIMPFATLPAPSFPGRTRSQLSSRNELLHLAAPSFYVHWVLPAQWGSLSKYSIAKFKASPIQRLR